MSKNIRTQLKKIVGKSLNVYYSRTKPTIDELHFKEKYQGRIVDCMVGEIDDNYIETPPTDNSIVKLEHSKEGVVKIPSIKGKTILLDVDGNETDTPSEGCVLKSVGEDEENKLIILSKNKNLFDGQMERGTLSASTGENVNYEKEVRSVNYIKLPKSKKVTATYTFNGTMGVRYYDKSFKFIMANGCYNGEMLKDVPLNAEYIRVKFIDTDLTKNLQLEEGSVATSYVKPLSNKTEILINEPLRSLPNGVCDEIVGNNLIRRVGRVILDGSENWSKTSYNSFITYKVSKLLKVSQKEININNNRFLNVDKDTITKIPNINCVGVSSITSGNRIHISMLDLIEEESESLVAWLSENPIEVIYELKEPIIEELPNSINVQGFDNTTMYIENSITPTVTYGYNALIPYKEELKTQKEEVDTNTLDIENNIIPYLMDMEFNLMMMEDKQ